MIGKRNSELPFEPERYELYSEPAYRFEPPGGNSSGFWAAALLWPSRFRMRLRLRRPAGEVGAEEAGHPRTSRRGCTSARTAR